MVPIADSDTQFLGFKWRDHIYKDCALPMGCASSSAIFQCISDALVWIVQAKFGAGKIIVLDDFLFVGESQQSCEDSLRGFEYMCQQLCIPLHPEKTVRPCQSLTFLGVEIDLPVNEMRLPHEKVEKARAAVSSLLLRKKAALREVQACNGLLHFACLAVPLGRPFLRRMFNLCRGVRRPYHRVSITKEARLDLQEWLTFLSNFNGRSLLERRRWLSDAGLLLETDAAGSVGLGAICGSRWLAGVCPSWLCDADIGVKELIAVVVPVHIWSDVLACRCVTVRSDNSGVVTALNSQSSRSAAAMVWLRHLFRVTVKHDILLRAVHIPGVNNAAPDALSRGSIQVFRSLRPTADTCATRWDWSDFAMLRQ